MEEIIKIIKNKIKPSRMRLKRGRYFGLKVIKISQAKKIISAKAIK